MTPSNELTTGPIMLLADSQLLLTVAAGAELQTALRQDVARSGGKFAVYAGAANGCEAVFYEMACDAMGRLGIAKTLFLKKDLCDLGGYAEQAPVLILLAGGDPDMGWRVLGQPHLRSWLIRCHQAGSVLVGVSAGAIHLTSAITEVDGVSTVLPFLDLYPAVTLVHEEREGWPSEAYYNKLDQEQMSECFLLPFGAAVRVAGHGSGDQPLKGFGRVRPMVLRHGTRIVL